MAVMLLELVEGDIPGEGTAVGLQYRGSSEGLTFLEPRPAEELKEGQSEASPRLSKRFFEFATRPSPHVDMTEER